MNDAADIIKQLPMETPMHAMMYVMLALLSFITVFLFLKVMGFHWEKGKGFRFNVHKQDIDPNSDCPYTKTRNEEKAAIKSIEDQLSKISLDLNSVKEQSIETRADVKNVIIDQQKQLFVDEKQAVEERLIAGLRYLYHGQNGALKTQMLRFISEHREAYNSIIKLKPELAVKGIGLVGSNTEHYGKGGKI